LGAIVNRFFSELRERGVCGVMKTVTKIVAVGLVVAVVCA